MEKTYTSQAVRAATGIGASALKMWHQRGQFYMSSDVAGEKVPHKRRRYTGEDVATLAVAQSLTACGVALDDASKIMGELRVLPAWRDALAGYFSEGKRVHPALCVKYLDGQKDGGRKIMSVELNDPADSTLMRGFFQTAGALEGADGSRRYTRTAAYGVFPHVWWTLRRLNAQDKSSK